MGLNPDEWELYDMQFKQIHEHINMKLRGHETKKFVHAQKVDAKLDETKEEKVQFLEA